MALMIKTGTVVENNRGNLTVVVERNEACGACASKESCGQRGETIIEVFSPDDIGVGDQVVVTSDSSDITKFSLYVYVLPVVMMIIGAALPTLLLKNTTMDINLLTLGSVLVFLLISFGIIRNLDKKVEHENIVKVRKI